MTQDPLDGVAAAREVFDQVVREIQAIPEFRDLHTTPTFDAVSSATGASPLVYLSATESTGTALVVRDGDVIPVSLGLTAGDLRTRVHQYFHAYQALRRETTRQNRADWQVALDEITEWLWDAAMGPVLDAVSGAAQTTLVACGQLGLLPLHAAWTPDTASPTGRRYAVDATAISYAANAQAHRECARRAATITGRRLLAVVDPNPDLADALPDTEWEAASAAARFPEGTVLRHAEADLKTVEQLMGSAQILQFGCHGVAMLGAPLRSRLQLTGSDVLDLARVLGMRLAVRLAVLSACETALIGLDLPDEVVSMPTGLVQAGVAGVLAAMWSVEQRSSAIHMVEFYRRWTDCAPALALAETQRWLRDVTLEEFQRSWDSALDEEAEWLPPEFGDRVLDDLVGRPGPMTQRPWSGISDWAAFTLTGV